MDADAVFRQRVGARLRDARARKGLSQAALGRLLPGPVEGAYVSRWERGENLPSWANLRALADALDVTVASLIDED